MKRILLPNLLLLLLTFALNAKTQNLYLTPNPNDCVNCLVPLAMAKAISLQLHPTLILPEMSGKDAKYLVTKQWKLDTSRVKYRVADSLYHALDPTGRSFVHLMDTSGNRWLQIPLKELSFEVERINGFFRQMGSPKGIATVPDHIHLPGWNNIIPQKNSLLFLNHASSSVSYWNQEGKEWLQFHPDDWQFPHLDTVLQYFPPNQAERWERLANLYAINMPVLKYEHAHAEGNSIWITAKYLSEQGIVNLQRQLRTDPVLLQYTTEGKFQAAHFVNLDSLREAGIVLGQHTFWVEGKTAYLPLKQGSKDKPIPYLNGQFQLRENQWRFKAMTEDQYPDSTGLDTLPYEAKIPRIHSDHIAFGANKQIWDRENRTTITLQIPTDCRLIKTIQSPEGYLAVLSYTDQPPYFAATFDAEGQLQHISPLPTPSKIKSHPQFLNNHQIIYLDLSDQLMQVETQ